MDQLSILKNPGGKHSEKLTRLMPRLWVILTFSSLCTHFLNNHDKDVCLLGIWQFLMWFWQFLCKLNTELLYDLKFHPWLYKICSNKNLYLNVHSSAIQIRQRTLSNPMSSKGWTNSIWYIHIMEHYLTIKRNEVLTPATTEMNPENIMLSERSQMQKAMYCMIPFKWSILTRKQISGCLGLQGEGLMTIGVL